MSKSITVAAVLTELARQYELHNDPGVSDLYNKQPFPIHMPLGTLRGAKNLLAAYLVSAVNANDLVAALKDAQAAISYAMRGTSDLEQTEKYGATMKQIAAALTKAQQQ